MFPLLLIAFLVCELNAANADEIGNFQHTEMAVLEIDIGHAQRTIGVRQLPSSGHEVARYTKIIARDPNNDDAYFRRAIANLYAGALPSALADMKHATELDQTYAYYAVWLDILDKRDHQASRLSQALSQIDMTKWPAPIVRLFLGQAAPAEVLAAADVADPVTKKGQMCEANFYIGELPLLQDANEEAERRFRVAATDCPRQVDFVEGAAADAELRALGVSP
jgi:lipoprotein NlpI